MRSRSCLSCSIIAQNSDILTRYFALAMTAEFFNSIHPSRPFAAVVAARLLRPWQRIRGPSAVTQDVTIFGTVTLASLVRSTRALQDCSDRVLAEPDMAADQPVAQTSLCQLEDLLRLAVRWTLSWRALAAAMPDLMALS